MLTHVLLTTPHWVYRLDPPPPLINQLTKLKLSIIIISPHISYSVTAYIINILLSNWLAYGVWPFPAVSYLIYVPLTPLELTSSTYTPMRLPGWRWRHIHTHQWLNALIRPVVTSCLFYQSDRTYRWRESTHNIQDGSVCVWGSCEEIPNTRVE